MCTAKHDKQFWELLFQKFLTPCTQCRLFHSAHATSMSPCCPHPRPHKKPPPHRPPAHGWHRLSFLASSTWYKTMECICVMLAMYSFLFVSPSVLRALRKVLPAGDNSMKFSRGRCLTSDQPSHASSEATLMKIVLGCCLMLSTGGDDDRRW